jgi:ABC-type transport system substrate-binding protein
MAFEAGDIDYISYGYDTFQKIKEYTNVKTETRFAGNTYYIINNCDAGRATSDIRVREAVQWAFDREELALYQEDDAEEIISMITGARSGRAACENLSEPV